MGGWGSEGWERAEPTEAKLTIIDSNQPQWRRRRCLLDEVHDVKVWQTIDSTSIHTNDAVTCEGARDKRIWLSPLKWTSGQSHTDRHPSIHTPGRDTDSYTLHRTLQPAHLARVQPSRHVIQAQHSPRGSGSHLEADRQSDRVSSHNIERAGQRGIRRVYALTRGLTNLTNKLEAKP